MQRKGYGDQKVLIFQRGGMRGMKSCGCREHWRTSENAQDKILRNTTEEMGPNDASGIVWATSKFFFSFTFN